MQVGDLTLDSREYGSNVEASESICREKSLPCLTT